MPAVLVQTYRVSKPQPVPRVQASPSIKSSADVHKRALADSHTAWASANVPVVQAVTPAAKLLDSAYGHAEERFAHPVKPGVRGSVAEQHRTAAALVSATHCGGRLLSRLPSGRPIRCTWHAGGGGGVGGGGVGIGVVGGGVVGGAMVVETGSGRVFTGGVS